MENSTKSKLIKLCVTALMIALSTALSLVKVVQMPLGGSVTLLSMVPMCLVAVLYGTAYAVLPCLLYGFLQIFLGGVFGWGLTPAVLIACIALDYLLAYGSLCLAGVFRNKKYGVTAGVALACFARFVFHFISGSVLFRSFDVFNNPYIYSLCYNGLYMLPELVITVIGVVLLCKTGVVDRIKKMTKA